jgi:hypothetical protein
LKLIGKKRLATKNITCSDGMSGVSGEGKLKGEPVAQW